MTRDLSAGTAPLLVVCGRVEATAGQSSRASWTVGAGRQKYFHRSLRLDSRDPKTYLPAMNHRERITIDPRTRSGKPCIRSPRITVADE